MRLSYTVLQSYMSMVRSAATDLDFAAAVAAGERGLRARDELTALNSAFTTTKLESGYAFWPGEIQQYRELIPFINGEKGTLIAKLPLLWDFHRDQPGNGMAKGFLDGPIDLSFWNAHGQEFDVAARKDYPGDQWETIGRIFMFRRKACVFQTSKVSSAICGIARMCNFQRRRRARHRTSVFPACSTTANYMSMEWRSQSARSRICGG
jgi:hypothetical protein